MSDIFFFTTTDSAILSVVDGKDIGKFYSPFMCLDHDITIRETFGREIGIPVEMLKEGFVWNGNNILNFHYLYCKSTIDWLNWRKTNGGALFEEMKKKLVQIVDKNYLSCISDEEKQERESKREMALSIQRERSEKVDFLKMTEHFEQIFEFARAYIRNEEIRQVVGHCYADCVKGFSAKDFRILHDREDIYTKKEKEDKARSWNFLNLSKEETERAMN